MNIRAIAVASVLAIGLPGCVTAIKQREVNTALTDVGFTQEDARCLARQASRNLSISQLRSLQRAAGSLQQPIREMPVGDVIDNIRAHVDPETLQAVGRMAADCARARTGANGG